MDKGAWWATVQSRRELDTTEHTRAHTSDLEVKAFHDVAGPSVQSFVHLWTPCSSGLASSLPHRAMPVQFPGAQSAFPTSALCPDFSYLFHSLETQR